MKSKIITLTLLFLSLQLQAQVGFNAIGTAPAPSAMLDVSATNKGLLMPRIADPANNIPCHWFNGL